MRTKRADVLCVSSVEGEAVRPRPIASETEDAPLNRFDKAVACAMARYSAGEWVLLEPKKRTDTIYAELRRLDAAAARQRTSGKPR